MSITAFDLISLATTRLGAEEVASYEDGTNEARFAGLIYPNAVQAELSTYFWNFTLKTEELVQTLDTPKDRRWRFSYARPSLVLREIAVLDRSGFPVPYQLEGTRILTNTKPAFLKYHEQKPEEQWPGYFRDLIVSRLAYDLAMPLTADPNIARLMAQEYAQRQRDARIVDAQSDDFTPIINAENSPYVARRF